MLYGLVPESLFGTAGFEFSLRLWRAVVLRPSAWIGIAIIYFIAERVRKISKITLTVY